MPDPRGHGLETVVLATANGYSDALGYAVGTLFVLVALWMWVRQRRAGASDSERRHQAAVTDGVDKLDAALPIYVDDYPSRESALDSARAGDVADLSRRERWRYRWDHLAADCPTLRYVRVEDADGRPIYLTDVSGYRLAHRRRSTLREQIDTVLDALEDDSDVPATMAEYYYRDVVEGRVDLDRSQSRVRGDAKTRIESNIAREGDLDVSELAETLVFEDGFRYPPHVVEAKLRELLDRDIRARKDGTVVYQRYS